MVESLRQLLRDQLALMTAAARVLEESRERVAAIEPWLAGELSVGERESCEALAAAPELLDAAGRVLRYVADKGYA